MMRCMTVLTQKNAFLQLDKNTFPRPSSHRAKVRGFRLRVPMVQVERARVLIKTANLAFTPKLHNCAKTPFLSLLYIVCVVTSATKPAFVAVELGRISLPAMSAPVRFLRMHVT